MGLDLSIILLEEHSEYWSNDCIMLNRSEALFDAIKELNPKPLPDPMKFYPPNESSASSEGWITTDCYGDEITFVPRRQLAELHLNEGVLSSAKKSRHLGHD